MKQFFNLFRKELSENAKNLTYIFIATTLIVPAIMAYSYFIRVKEEVFYEVNFISIYPFMILIIGILSSYLAFRFVEKKNKIIAEISLPASIFQKWLVKFVVYTIFHLIFYSLLFFLMYKIGIFMIEKNNISIEPYSVFDKDSLDGFIVASIVTYFMTQSFFYSSILTFKRFAFLKSLVTVSLGIFLFIIFNLYLTGILGREDIFFVTDRITIDSYGSYEVYYKASYAFYILKSNLFVVGLPLLFYMVSYFKFKEKEVR
ncbi:hypothetical protein CGC48_04170 [Capnocytophaga cynodegmi]|uniref:Uncharacterized protein n=1 Tax=Capnocytophaga cynodegmi TaxID=28189 RepID=A0A250E825_9FLAO|nr:hypothetical protein [Capnocytophaga cynodegmi]ATA67898.1 hypothetical protein CGC48_04170 [Capnocytophaga cynodegmi]